MTKIIIITMFRYDCLLIYLLVNLLVVCMYNHLHLHSLREAEIALCHTKVSTNSI